MCFVNPWYLFHTSGRHVNSGLLNALHVYYRSLDPFPDSHERKAKEKAKGSPKLCEPGLESVNQRLLLNPGVLGNRPEAEGHQTIWTFGGEKLL